MTTIKYDLVEMRKMIDILHASAKKLEDTRAEMQGLAKEIDDGALIGEGGTALSTAVRGNLCASVDKLVVELRNQAAYVQKEIDEIESAAGTSGESTRQY